MNGSRGGVSPEPVDFPRDQGDGKDREIEGQKDPGHGKGRIGHGCYVSQKEHGAGVIADREKETAFRKADTLLFHKFTAGFGPHGIAAEETGHQHIAAAVGQAKETFEYRAHWSGQQADPV